MATNPYQEAGLKYFRRKSRKDEDWEWGGSTESKSDITPEEDEATIRADESMVQAAIDRQRKQIAEAKEDVRTQAEERAKEKSFLDKAKSLVLDIPNADSPEDRARRLAAGQLEFYADDQKRKKEVAETFNRETKEPFEMAKNFDFSGGPPGGFSARKEIYKKHGIDLDQFLADKISYGRFIEAAKGQSLSEYTKRNAIPEEAKRFEKTVKKAERAELDYQRGKRIEAGAESGIAQAERAFVQGVAEPLLNIQPNLMVASGALGEAILPEGSEMDTTSEGLIASGAAMKEELARRMVDRGYGPGRADNPLITGLGQGAGSLVASLTAAAAGGGAGTAAEVFGLSAGSEQYLEAKKAGQGDVRAFATGATAGVAEGLLEKVGLDKFLGASGSGVKKTFTRMLTEGTQEMTQSLAQSGVKGTYEDVDIGLAVQGALAEGGLGAIIGGGASLPMNIAQDLTAKGVPEEVAVDAGMKARDKMAQVLMEEKVGGPEQPETPTTQGDKKPPAQSIPDLETTEAEDDWEDNFKPRVAELGDKILELDKKAKVKGTTRAFKEKIQADIDKISREQGEIGEQWRNKWKHTVVDGEEPGPLRPKSPSIRQIDESTGLPKNIVDEFEGQKTLETPAPSAGLVHVGDNNNGWKGEEAVNAQITKWSKQHPDREFIAVKHPSGYPASKKIFAIKAQAKPKQKQEQPSAPKPTITPQIGRRQNESDKDFATRYVKENPERVQKDYDKRVMEEFGVNTPNVVSGDEAKFVIPGFKPAHSGTYHEPASAFAKSHYKRLLAKPDTKNQEVLIMAGGAGAGKSSGLRKLSEADVSLENFAAINDTNMTTEKSASDRIEPALESGRNVRIMYVYRDPVDSFVNGNIPRATKTGRLVPIEGHVNTHADSLETIKKVAEQYKDDPRVTIEVTDNSRGPGNAVLETVDFLADKSHNKKQLTQELLDELEKAKQQDKVTEEIYQTYKEGLRTGVRSQPEQERQELPVKKEGEGYDPAHPWYYKEGGKILTTNEIIDAAEKSTYVPPTKKKIADYRADLKKDIERYNELVRGGINALTDPNPDEMTYFTALALKHNHITFGAGQIKRLGGRFTKVGGGSRQQQKQPSVATPPPVPTTGETIQLRYPDLEELPAELKKRLPEIQRGAGFVKKVPDKITTTELGSVAGADIKWRRADLKNLIKLVPGLQENPVLTVAKERVAEYSSYRGSEYREGPELVLKYKDATNDLTIPLRRIGISDKRADAAGIKEDMKLDMSGVLAPGTNKVPTVRSGGQDFMADFTARGDALNALADYSERPRKDGRETIKTAEELTKLAGLLNKAAQAGAVLRRGDYRSKKNLGVAVQRKAKQGGGNEVVKLQNKVIQDPRLYATVLAHELSHAIEQNINGSSRKTLSLFGELSKEEKDQITNELKDIVDNIEGKAIAQARPEYFYKPTEMLARYVETLVLHPGQAEKLAPLTTEKYGELVVREPMAADLMAAIDGALDKGFRNYTPEFAKDLRQMYRKHLGKRAGDIAYNAEVVRRAEIQRSQKLIGDLVKRKFKGIKDDPALLFRAAEAIKITENGQPEFGTHDFMDAKNETEAAELEKAGWEATDPDQVLENGDVKVYSRPRYTPDQAEKIFNELSPEGQQLIKDFTAAKEEAKDEFNRELMKEIYHIDSKLEGWVHHYFEGKPFAGSSKTTLRTKVAGAKKHRKGAEGYIEDFRKATEKALLELDRADINNSFITKQLARISKPIAKGDKPEAGWVEVVADEKGGLRLPGEGMQVIVKPDEGKAIRVPQKRYQVPRALADHYREIRDLPQEANRVAKTLNQIAKYWTINVLTHPGTTSTNFISGGLQYGAKIMNDFYLDLLSMNVGMERTRADLVAPLKVLTPRGWSNAPDWLYGGYRSTLIGQYATAGSDTRVDKGIDKYGNKALLAFSAVETYWKKVIATSEGSKLSPASSRRVATRLHKEEQEIVAKLNEVIDEYAFDYDNKPLWLSQFDRKGGKLVKPFTTYPYKLTKFYTGHVAAGFDRTRPWQERTAKVLTIATIVAFIAMAYKRQEDEAETPKGTEKTPFALKPGGRVFIGATKGGQELFVRTAKYPFFNLTSAGKAIVDRNGTEIVDLFREQFGTTGPGLDLALLAIGKKDQFDQYKPTGVILAEQAATAIPGFRILNDIGRMIDKSTRKPETFVQGVGSNLPIWGSEETRTKLRGDKRTIRIPDETEEPRSISKSARTFTEREMVRERGDILMSLLSGVYLSRISPQEAKQQERREIRDEAERKIRDFLAAGNEADAEALGEEYGLIITEEVKKYYRRKK